MCVSFTLRMLPTFLSGPVAGRCSMVAPPRDGASGEARGSAKCFACFAFPVTMAPVGRTCASRGPRRCCFVRLPREPAGSERLMPCSGWSTPVYLQHGGLQSWSSLVLLASVRFGQPSRTSGNTVASRPRSQHCHLRLPGSSS